MCLWGWMFTCNAGVSSSTLNAWFTGDSSVLGCNASATESMFVAASSDFDLSKETNYSRNIYSHSIYLA